MSYDQILKSHVMDILIGHDVCNLQEFTERLIQFRAIDKEIIQLTYTKVMAELVGSIIE